MLQVIRKGLSNDWTITHMAKELSKETGKGKDYTKRMIKQKIGEGIGKEL